MRIKVKLIENDGALQDFENKINAFIESEECEQVLNSHPIEGGILLVYTPDKPPVFSPEGRVVTNE